MVKLTVKKFRDCAVNTGGILQAIADNAKVTRVSIYHFLKKHPELQEVLDHEREKIVDMAEGSLFSQVKDKSEWATKFLLKTKGRNRGYIERQEVEHSGGVNNNVTLVIESDKDNYPQIEEKKAKK